MGDDNQNVNDSLNDSGNKFTSILNTSAMSKKGNKITNIIVAVFVLAVLLIVFVFSPSRGKLECEDNIDFDGYTFFDNVMAMYYDETQYVFESKFDSEFLKFVDDFDNITFKICSREAAKDEYNFAFLDASNTKVVESFELYDKESNKKLSSRDKDSLLEELGYHSFGAHAEEAEVVSFSTNLSGFNLKYHKVEIKLKSGKIVEAHYGVTNKVDKIKNLKENETYNFEFRVVRDDFEPFVYLIDDFT